MRGVSGCVESDSWSVWRSIRGLVEGVVMALAKDPLNCQRDRVQRHFGCEFISKVNCISALRCLGVAQLQLSR